MPHVLLEEDFILSLESIRTINRVTIYNKPEVVHALRLLGLIDKDPKARLILTQDVNDEKGIFYPLFVKIDGFNGQVSFYQGFEYYGESKEDMIKSFNSTLEALREGRVSLSLTLSTEIEKYGIVIVSRKEKCRQAGMQLAKELEEQGGEIVGIGNAGTDEKPAIHLILDINSKRFVPPLNYKGFRVEFDYDKIEV